ncbi:MAG: alpha/beta hydrolase [Gammaproteobacteria bacterium]|nr:MAG: alpha/beta hydrolase [Gammaproteobacteria bacterium]
MNHKNLLLFSVILLIVLAGFGSLQFYRYPIYDAAMQFEAERAQLEKKHVTVDGLDWVYYAGPSHEGAETVVMIHGFAASKENWLRYARFFTDQFNVIAPDLPGHGETSSPLDLDYTIEAQAARVKAFLDALGVKKAHLIGNSMGGAISAVFGAQYPETAVTLTLIDPAGVFDVPAVLDQELAAGRNPLIVASRQDFNRLLDFALEKKPFIPWPVSQVAAEKAMARKAVNDKIFSDISHERPRVSDFKRWLKQIQAPTLIIWGDQDRVINVKNGEVFDREIPRSRLVVLKGIGHAPMIEVPEQTAQLTLDFLRSASVQ